ncbi:MAG: signal peptide peptidase SppA [Candidatus Kapabacteria bacterium]|nr:signal peptide peptidase SppA [Ignavibacteriota bacterium]MCW5884272.1 signal peptide peptidase SppA [Candidatus Kapabacteria bacterium]
MMKNIYIAVTILFCTFLNSYSQSSFTTYYELMDLQAGSPGAFKSGLYGFDNPALLNYNHSDFDLLLLANDRGGELFDFNRTAAFYSSRGFGFGILNNKFGDQGYTDYRISSGFGDRIFSMGFTYGWTSTRGGIDRSSNMMAVGGLYRPNAYLSIGGNYSFALDNSDDELVGEVGIRPFGNELITLFADASRLKGQDFEDVNWSAGVIVEPLAGIRINARHFAAMEMTTVGVNISSGLNGLLGINVMDKGGKSLSNTYGIRVGGMDRTMIEDVLLSKYYATLDLSSGVKYVKNMWFDNSQTLLNILTAIDKAGNDKSAMGIVINATQFSASRSIMWEIRNKLDEAKSKGKKIIIFIERANIDQYHFASVADEIVLDPQGGVTLEGFAMGRSFYKNLLEKADIGYEELRFYKYKSAAESYSRENFSAGDREQRQRIVDEWYELVKNDVSNSRKSISGNFDNLVNDELGYLAKDALDKKLVDKLDRWNNIKKFMKNYDRNTGVRSIYNIDKYPMPFDDKWGDSEKRIAVIYAEGVCALNSGINARLLSEILRKNYESSSVSAIVLRIDSPGGDAMASDYISSVIAEYKGKKPLIVSQGQVAASGGYWLSMEADKIFAAPNTITGSIGVISSWFYDKGLKDSLGITYDIVKKGKYADLGASYQLPFIPIGLPLRNFTEDERNQREKQIRALYNEFVTKVAESRKMTYEKVDELGEGRVWTGTDAIKNGLIDEIGTLYDAIQFAKSEAGIPKDKKVKLLEFPTGNLFDFTSFLGNIFSVNIPRIDSSFEELKFLLENNGNPMPVMSIDYLGL